MERRTSALTPRGVDAHRPGPGSIRWSTAPASIMWQSLTQSAATTRVPTDAGVLAARLGLGRGAQSAAGPAMLGELMAAIWQLRAA